MPSIHTYVPKDDIASRRIFYCEGDCPPLGNWPSGVYYGDGSGGEHGLYPATRRCGVAIAALNEQHDFHFGIKYPLPGEVQTVPRAELSALVTLVEIAEVGSNIIYIGDNLPIIKLYNKGKDVVEGPQTQIFSNYFSNTLNNGTFSLQLFGFHPTSTIPKQRPARVCQNPGQIGYRIMT